MLHVDGGKEMDTGRSATYEKGITSIASATTFTLALIHSALR